MQTIIISGLKNCMLNIDYFTKKNYVLNNINYTLSSLEVASCIPFMTDDLNDSTDDPLESTKAMVEYCKRGLLSLTILNLLRWMVIVMITTDKSFLEDL